MPVDVAWVYVSTLKALLKPLHLPTPQARHIPPLLHHTPSGTSPGHQPSAPAIHPRGTTSTWGATSQGHRATFITQAAKSDICLTCKDTELTATFDSMRKLQMLKWSNWVGWKLWFPTQNSIYRICCLKTPFLQPHKAETLKVFRGTQQIPQLLHKKRVWGCPSSQQQSWHSQGSWSSPLLWHWSPPGCCGKPRAPLYAWATPSQGSQQGAALTPGTTRERIPHLKEATCCSTVTLQVLLRRKLHQNKYAAPQAQQVLYVWYTIVKALKWNRGEINLFYLETY